MAGPHVSDETVERVRGVVALFSSLREGLLLCEAREIGSILRRLDMDPSEEQLALLTEELLESRPPKPAPSAGATTDDGAAEAEPAEASEEDTGDAHWLAASRVEQACLRLLAEKAYPRVSAAELAAAFAVLDREKRGYLTADEFRRALCELGETFDEAEAADALGVAMTADGKIDYVQYAALLAGQPEI